MRAGRSLPASSGSRLDADGSGYTARPVELDGHKSLTWMAMIAAFDGADDQFRDIEGSAKQVRVILPAKPPRGSASFHLGGSRR